MLERAKSLTLTALVLLSIQLTSLFWMRTNVSVPPMLTPGSVNQPVADTLVPMEMLRPLSILIHNQSVKYWLTADLAAYQDLWDKLKDSPAGANPHADRDVGPDNLEVGLRIDDWMEAAASGSAYEYRFAGPVQLNLWWLTASKSTRQKFQPDLHFNRMLISDGDSHNHYVYFMNTANQSIWRWQWSSKGNDQYFPEPSELALSKLPDWRRVKAIRGVSSDEGQLNIALMPGSIFAPVGPMKLPELRAVLPILEDNRKEIVAKFFNIIPRFLKADHNKQTGELVETWITSREQALSLHNTGWLHYTDPVQQLGPGWTTIDLKFLQALGYITSHSLTKKPANSIVIAGMNDVSSVYGDPAQRFNFIQVSNSAWGLPIIDVTPTVQVDVTDHGVRMYKSNLYTLLPRSWYPDAKMLTAEQALQSAAAPIGRRLVVDLYPAYYQCKYGFTSERPFFSEEEDIMYIPPVWVIELADGSKILVNARSGVIEGTGN